MKNEEIFQEMLDGKYLLALTDDQGKIMWQTSVSPVGAAFQAFFNKEIKVASYDSMYTNQMGIGLSILCMILDIKKCYAEKVSTPALLNCKKYEIDIEYMDEVDLVKSSKNKDETCPIEIHLNENPDYSKQVEFLNERYGSADAKLSCGIKKS